MTVTSTSTVQIGFGHFLPGGQLLPASIRGYNETYRGYIEVDESRVQAYVKFLSPWEIFNEALGSVLSQLVGLPTPKSFLVIVDRNEYPSETLFPDPQINKAIAFASQALPAQALSRRISASSFPALRTLVEAWIEWPDVLLFDQWIANPDRHTGNVLVGRPGEFYLIDHGLCFHRQNWSPAEALASVSAVFTRLWTEFLHSVVPLPKRLEATQRVIAASAAQASVDLAAAIALTQVQRLIPAQNISALLQALPMRRIAAPYVVCSTLGHPILPFGEPE